MNDSKGPFAPHADDVVAKVIDGELIIIRLSDGTYYSMDGAGAWAWQLIDAGHDLPAIVGALSAGYGAAPAAVDAGLADLVGQLLAEGLIAPVAGGATPPAPDATPPAGSGGWEAPRLNVYRDMGNLLALDPPTPGIDDMPLKGGKYR